MKKYQMPNVKEERLESSLFIMDGASPVESNPEQPGNPGTKPPFGAPRHL